jgi:Asp-tRNA(Asn)/Glu-tRNA(Gln) amidotransferase B subunit
MQPDQDFLKQWEQIIESVDLDNVPIDLVKKVVFRTFNRKQKTINLNQLRKQGIDSDSIDKAVTTFISANEDEISSMELVLDIEAVAGIVQPETDKLLKGMK